MEPFDRSIDTRDRPHPPQDRDRSRPSPTASAPCAAPATSTIRTAGPHEARIAPRAGRSAAAGAPGLSIRNSWRRGAPRRRPARPARPAAGCRGGSAAHDSGAGRRRRSRRHGGPRSGRGGGEEDSAGAGVDDREGGAGGAAAPGGDRVAAGEIGPLRRLAREQRPPAAGLGRGENQAGLAGHRPDLRAKVLEPGRIRHPVAPDTSNRRRAPPPPARAGSGRIRASRQSNPRLGAFHPRPFSSRVRTRYRQRP